MPTKPLRPCRHPGCTALTKEAYCDLHKRSYDRQRGTAAQRGYSHKWALYRKRFLSRSPLCVICEREGKITPATVVDHIKPHKGDQALFWDTSNHQSLCKRHHDIKTAKEDGGFGRRNK